MSSENNSNTDNQDIPSSNPSEEGSYSGSSDWITTDTSNSLSTKGLTSESDFGKDLEE